MSLFKSGWLERWDGAGWKTGPKTEGHAGNANPGGANGHPFGPKGLDFTPPASAAEFVDKLKVMWESARNAPPHPVGKVVVVSVLLWLPIVAGGAWFFGFVMPEVRLRLHERAVRRELLRLDRDQRVLMYLRLSDPSQASQNVAQATSELTHSSPTSSSSTLTSSSSSPQTSSSPTSQGPFSASAAYTRPSLEFFALARLGRSLREDAMARIASLEQRVAELTDELHRDPEKILTDPPKSSSPPPQQQQPAAVAAGSGSGSPGAASTSWRWYWPFGGPTTPKPEK